LGQKDEVIKSGERLAEEKSGCRRAVRSKGKPSNLVIDLPPITFLCIYLNTRHQYNPLKYLNYLD